jgi:hypothetical protein
MSSLSDDSRQRQTRGGASSDLHAFGRDRERRVPQTAIPFCLSGPDAQRSCATSLYESADPPLLSRPPGPSRSSVAPPHSITPALPPCRQHWPPAAAGHAYERFARLSLVTLVQETGSRGLSLVFEMGSTISHELFALFSPQGSYSSYRKDGSGAWPLDGAGSPSGSWTSHRSPTHGSFSPSSRPLLTLFSPSSHPLLTLFSPSSHPLLTLAHLRVPHNNPNERALSTESCLGSNP